jgi:hypothetical protein
MPPVVHSGHFGIESTTIHVPLKYQFMAYQFEQIGSIRLILLERYRHDKLPTGDGTQCTDIARICTERIIRNRISITRLPISHHQ